MAGVLDGIRVLDFGRYIAGPWCAALLGDFGADVIRIERIGGGEDRFVLPLSETDESGAMFLQVNRNKRGMTLDPTSEKGREIVRRLVASADVVVANLPEAALKTLGIDYDTLAAIKPDIILTTATAFGYGGPYERKVGFDSVAQAMSGIMYLSGEPGSPVKSFSPWVDYSTATLAAFGTAMALMNRQKTGEGQEVQGALLASALTVTNAALMEQAVKQTNRVATGNRGQLSAPSDVFQTKDGSVLVITVGQPMFNRWAALMGEEHWLTDHRFKDDDARGWNGEAISERMQAWCAERTTAEVMDTLEKARLPVAPVYSPQQALEDPHVRAAGFYEHLDYPGVKTPAPVTTTPVTAKKSPGTIRHRAPQLGEHTEAILGEVGYSAGEIAALREAGVI
jgi:crotonobetainyl-CoA:carnitine CoA-transferase CaiB-like acyl-CoA transferase